VLKKRAYSTILKEKCLSNSFVANIQNRSSSGISLNSFDANPLLTGVIALPRELKYLPEKEVLLFYVITPRSDNTVHLGTKFEEGYSVTSSP
jgi:hypothetical protein